MFKWIVGFCLALQIASASIVNLSQPLYNIWCSDNFLWTNDAILELVDGSRWSCTSDISHWQCRDEIVVTQNTSWFSQHEYALINNTYYRESVPATLEDGPLKDGPARRTLRVKDFRSIVLDDDTYWEVESHFDIRDWAPGDTVILGVNSAWDSFLYDCILINVNMNNYAKVR